MRKKEGGSVFFTPGLDPEGTQGHLLSIQVATVKASFCQRNIVDNAQKPNCILLRFAHDPSTVIPYTNTNGIKAGNIRFNSSRNWYRYVQ